MGSGGKFRADSIPIEKSVGSLAALANLRDAVDKAETYLITVMNRPNDVGAWGALESEIDRIKLRGMTTVSELRNLLNSQKKDKA